MNPFNIVCLLFEALHSAWNTAVTMGHWVSAELVCSVTVNLAVLSVVLLGAIWLVAPFDLRWRSARRNRAEHS